ncbi:putative long-chain-fatty-acid-CoA ligase [Leishmania major strain Friedlin]|uniref:Putative long-chain-fatty-acid-CoA ligase n=1 Tax=Leishmania major TaxID=5664 RepID=E9AC44_LEIMA|nr:putative long-chain-fatty-acid-CoA ligase [Leishmania major strain Friedlin]CAG9567118.1 long-chain-fatty-acid-CoA_ligase_-_putative [Leishmania major strain Friedlin]CBZ11858.1 putative long-chain-fatty-acid-CoA ligase [Leishmania major strain Friedlin]|eukprot:XP_003721575.1 putative long-chain-fatty-acid-CoA ligase [Leishmania major strain Friedlin]
MGALLVTLLQCRNNQSLYPNLSATHHNQYVSCRQPCSVPLLADARAYGRQSHQHSSLMTSTTATMPTDAAGDEATSGPPVARRVQSTHAGTPSSTSFAGAVSDMRGADKQPVNLSKVCQDGGATGATTVDADGDAAAAISRLLATKSTPTPAVGNALCTNTLPTVPPLSSARMASPPSATPPTQPQNCPSLPSATVFMPSATAAAPLAPTAPLKRQCSNDAESRLAMLLPATSMPMPTPTLAAAGGLSLTSQDAPVATDCDTVKRMALPGDNAAAARPGAANNAGGNVDIDDDELGPMDCADAFQYFFDEDEGVYRDVESAVYAAPQMAHVSMPVLRDHYLSLRTALCTEKSSAALTTPSVPPLQGGSVAPTIPSIFLLGASANAGGGGVAIKMAAWSLAQQPPPQQALKALGRPQQTPLNLHDALHASLTRALLETGEDLDDNAHNAATANDVAAADAPSGLPPGAGRFVSLVQEMAAACRRIGAAPFVCWRSIDRVTALPPENPLWRRLHNGGGGRVDNAHGEAEDDTSCPPVSDAPRKRRSHPSALPDGVGGSGTEAHPSSSQQQSESLSLYYLGPQQYMTATVWWSRVEAFGFGLRSMGLHPGDLIGIVEDTRWEWLVTCYAAWSVGLVVVVFDSSARTMARVAMDTAPDMKALVCSPMVHRDVRRHYDAAAAAAAAAARSARAPAPVTPTASCDMTDCYGGEEDNDQHSHSACASGEAAAATWTGQRGKHDSAEATAPSERTAAKPRTKQPAPPPMFIVIRSAGPPRGGRSDGGDGRASATAAPRPWWSRTSMRERQPSHQAHGVTAEGHDEVVDAEEEDEEEEALWWSDVLMHGETKLKVWRQRKLRERRLQHQQQARLRHLKPQQRGARAGVGGNAVASSPPSSASLRRPRLCGGIGTDDLRGATSAAAASQDGSTTSVATSTQPGPTEAVSDSGTATACATSCAANTMPIMLVGAAAAATRDGKSGGSASFSSNDAARRALVPLRERNALTESPPRGSSGRSLSTLPAASALAGSAPTIAAPLMMIDDGPPQLPLAPLQPDDLAFILYTEGDPKGVLLTHGAVKASVAAHHEYLNSTDVDGDDGLRRVAGGCDALTGTATTSKNSGSTAESTGRGGQGSSRIARYTTAYMPALRSRTAPAGRPSYMAYLPLHDICEFVAETASLLRGLLVCYGTRRTLFDTWARPHGDLTEYKPTIFPALPATLARLRRTVESMVSTGYRQLLFEAAYEARRQAVRRGLHTPFLLSTIFAPSRKLLGGRCRLVLIRGGPGAAALHPRDQEYVEVVCGASLVQSYGVAETAGCGLQQAYCATQLDSIGGPLGPVHVKMRDVFATGATFVGSAATAAAASGSGCSPGWRVWTHQSERPTGELLLRGPTIMAGYYRQPEKTAAVLEKSGWLHTEEVVERCPDGSFRRIASLRPHHATTSNGHCVALEPLEALYAQHPLCLEGGVCVLVHPYRRYVCALVLTDEHHLRNFLQTTAAAAATLPSPHSQPTSPTSPLPSSPSPQRLLNWAALLAGEGWPQCLGDPALNQAAAASLAAWATQHGEAAPHERVRHVRVLYDVWDVAHHTRTATGRLFRPAIHYRYSGVIQELFAEED